MNYQFFIEAEDAASRAFNALGQFANKDDKGNFYIAARILAEVRLAANILTSNPAPEQAAEAQARLMEIFK
jgi:hypothetical protein